jgi:hypothetical protein
MNFNAKITLQTDKLIDYLTEKLPEMFMQLTTENSSLNAHPTVSASTPTDDVVKQRKGLLSKLLHDYLQTISQVQASTDLTNEENKTKSHISYCSTSTNT